jgi:hypothetical protein
MQVVMPKAATIAKKRCERFEVVVISRFPSWSPAAFPPDERKVAGTVPNSKNGGFLRFPEAAGNEVGFLAAPIWDFSPQIGVDAFPIEPGAALP